MMALSRTTTLLAFVLSACASTPAVQHQLVAPVLDEASLSVAERLGYRIYLKDVAASRATDAVLARQDIDHSRVSGWLTLLSGSQARILFIDRDGNASVWVDVDVATTAIPIVRRIDPPEPLDDTKSRMWRARRTAAATEYRRCSDRYNTVVLETPEADGWYVYLLAATTEPGVVMFGGHHRIRVSRDGGTVMEELPLTKSCIRQEPEAPSGASVAGLMVTHIITDEPMESHVYLSLLHGLPLYVVTESGVWAVEQGRVREPDE